MIRRRTEVALALASVILTLGLLEVGARLYYLATYRPALQTLAEHYTLPPKGATATLGDILRPSPFPKIVFEMKPNLDVSFEGAPLTTNSHGWRERELADTKSPRTIRIVGLGDSVMFGWGVPEEQRYMNLLERQLNEEFTEVHFETAAFAVPGYNLPMEVEVLKRYALSAHPDLIIYGYFENDHCLPFYVAAKKSIWSTDLFLKSYLFGSMNAWRGLLISRDAAVNEASADFESHYCSEENTQAEYRELVGKRNFYLALKELGQIGRSLHVPIVFLKHDPCTRFDGRPVPEGMEYVDPKPDYMRYLHEHGFWDLLSAGLIRSIVDPHPSPSGHQLIAEVLYRELVKRGIIEAIINAPHEQP